uniref:Uncharacterized protein n=1 Tax=Anguilla anguilla TaxID=7936 RepID=A0A0E9T3C5_ANGAN
MLLVLKFTQLPYSLKICKSTFLVENTKVAS